jgi:hypothetical protein
MHCFCRHRQLAHATGPFHRGLTQNYAVRIEAAASMWDSYAGASQPPHAVGVASSLWDVARLWFHERQELDGRSELSMELLQGWMANFTTVVDYSRQRLPQVHACGCGRGTACMMPAPDRRRAVPPGYASAQLSLTHALSPLSTHMLIRGVLLHRRSCG